MKQKILWAAAHELLPEQKEELKNLGDIIILKEDNPELWNRLTQLHPKDATTVRDELIDYINKKNIDVVAQMAGPPSFQHLIGGEQMADLYESRIFWSPEIKFVWSYSRRESKDIPQSDGTMKKVSIFKHQGFFLASGVSLVDYMFSG